MTKYEEMKKKVERLKKKHNQAKVFTINLSSGVVRKSVEGKQIVSETTLGVFIPALTNVRNGRGGIIELNDMNYSERCQINNVIEEYMQRIENERLSIQTKLDAIDELLS